MRHISKKFRPDFRNFPLPLVIQIRYFEIIPQLDPADANGTGYPEEGDDQHEVNCVCPPGFPRGWEYPDFQRGALFIPNLITIGGHYRERVTTRRQVGIGSLAVISGINPILIKPGQLVSVLRSEEHTSELQSRENLVC